MKHKLLVFLLVLVQLIVIVYLVIGLYQTFFANKVDVATMYKDDLNFMSGIEELNYFFEINIGEIVQNPTWLGYVATQTVTEQGFNEREEYVIERKLGTDRLVAIGDSFTYGYYVNTEESYPEQLEDTIRSRCATSSEVINAGVIGYDVEYAAARYIQKVKDFSPDVVLWLLSGNELGKINEIITPIELACREETEENDLIQPDGSVLYKCSTEAWEKHNELISNDVLLAHNKEIMSKLFEDRSTKWVLTYFKEGRQKILNDLIETFSGLPHVYFNEVDMPIRESSPFTLPDRHPSSLGHTTIAEDIFSFLKDEDLYECDQLK